MSPAQVYQYHSFKRNLFRSIRKTVLSTFNAWSFFNKISGVTLSLPNVIDKGAII